MSDPRGGNQSQAGDASADFDELGNNAPPGGDVDESEEQDYEQYSENENLLAAAESDLGEDIQDKDPKSDERLTLPKNLQVAKDKLTSAMNLYRKLSGHPIKFDQRLMSFEAPPDCEQAYLIGVMYSCLLDSPDISRIREEKEDGLAQLYDNLADADDQTDKERIAQQIDDETLDALNEVDRAMERMMDIPQLNFDTLCAFYTGFAIHESSKGNDSLGSFFVDMVATLSNGTKKASGKFAYYTFPFGLSSKAAYKLRSLGSYFVGLKQPKEDVFDRSQFMRYFPLSYTNEFTNYLNKHPFRAFKLSSTNDGLNAIICLEYNTETNLSERLPKLFPEKKRPRLTTGFYKMYEKTKSSKLKSWKDAVNDQRALTLYYTEPLIESLQLSGRIKAEDYDVYHLAMNTVWFDIFLERVHKPVPAIQFTSLVEEVTTKSDYYMTAAKKAREFLNGLLTGKPEEGETAVQAAQRNLPKSHIEPPVAAASTVPVVASRNNRNNNNNNNNNNGYPGYPGQPGYPGYGYPGQPGYPGYGPQPAQPQGGYVDQYGIYHPYAGVGAYGYGYRRFGKGRFRYTYPRNPAIKQHVEGINPLSGNYDAGMIEEKIGNFRQNDQIRKNLLNEINNGQFPKGGAGNAALKMTEGPKSSAAGSFVKSMRYKLTATTNALNRKTKHSVGKIVNKNAIVQDKIALRKAAQDKLSQNVSTTHKIFPFYVTNGSPSNAVADAASQQPKYSLINPYANSNYVVEFQKKIVEDGVKRVIRSTYYGYSIPAFPLASVKESLTNKNWQPTFGCFRVGGIYKQDVPTEFLGDISEPTLKWAYWPRGTKLQCQTNDEHVMFVLHRQLSIVYTDAQNQTHYKTVSTFPPTFNFKKTSRRTIADMDRNIMAGEPNPLGFHYKVTLPKRNVERNVILESKLSRINNGNFHMISNALLQIIPNQALLKEYYKRNRAYIDTLLIDFTSKAYLDVIHFVNGVNVGKIFTNWVNKTVADRDLRLAKVNVKKRLTQSIIKTGGDEPFFKTVQLEKQKLAARSLGTAGKRALKVS